MASVAKQDESEPSGGRKQVTRGRSARMSEYWREIRRTYLVLLTLHTFAASLVWGINTLFPFAGGLTISPPSREARSTRESFFMNGDMPRPQKG